MVAYDPTEEFQRRVFDIATTPQSRWRSVHAAWSKEPHKIGVAVPEVDNLITNGSAPQPLDELTKLIWFNSEVDILKVRDWITDKRPTKPYRISLRYTVQEQQWQYLKWLDGVIINFDADDFVLAFFFHTRWGGGTGREHVYA